MPAPDRSAPGSRGRFRWLCGAAVTALAITHVALVASSAWNTSSTFDEGLHVTAGYANWLGGDQRLHSGNGMLSQRWFALPLVLAPERFTFPAPDAIVADQPVDDFHLLTHFLAHVFFYEVGNEPEWILRYARTMGALVGVALIALVYGWARRLWGPAGGVLSAALCALSPNVVAHAGLATSDALFALLLLAALGLVWRSFWQPSLGIVIAAGIALGALALTKMSAVGVVPMVLVLTGLRLASPQPLAIPSTPTGELVTRPRRALALAGLLLVQALAAMAVVWAAFGFRFDVVPPGTPGRAAMEKQWEWVHERSGGLALGAIDALRAGRVLPEGFLFGAAFVVRHSEERASFFRGETRIGGDWRFFPYAMAVKTPLALFALLGLASAAALRAPPAERARLGRSAAPLAVAIAVHGGLAVSSPINLGLRHVLPLYPALFVLAGGALGATAPFGRTGRSLALALAGAFAFASLSIQPHPLAYFNVLVGPERGHRVLVDSSLDWGQDLDNLARDLKGRPEVAGIPIYLGYFGSPDPGYHDFGDLDVRLLPGFFDWSTIQHREAERELDWHLEPGLYAISATILQQPWSRVPRRWGPPQWRDYAALTARFSPLEQSAAPARRLRAALGDRATREAWLRYRELRLSRLCTVLREREPDWQVGFSINVYRVGAEELARVSADFAAPEAASAP